MELHLIRGGTITNTSPSGAALYVSSTGTVTISGGLLHKTNGGDTLIIRGGQVTQTGGTIIGGISATNGGTFNYSGGVNDEHPAVTQNDSSDSSENEPPKRTYLDDLSDKIEAMIALGGPKTIIWNDGNALTYNIMKLLEENPQITLVYSYSYDDVDYKVTIPGKYVKADTDIPWYGPLYLWANYWMYSENDSAAETPSQVTPTTTTATYTVVAGDTLSAIALRLHTTVEYLAYVNGISNPDKIRIGQVIKY